MSIQIALDIQTGREVFRTVLPRQFDNCIEASVAALHELSGSDYEVLSGPTEPVDALDEWELRHRESGDGAKLSLVRVAL